MKNILHVIQGGRGGTLDYLTMILENLDNKLYKCKVVCHGEIYDELCKKGFDCIYLEMDRKINLIKDLDCCIKLKNIIYKNNVDLLYLHSSKAGALGRIVNILTKKYCVYNPHGWSFNIDTNRLKKNIFGMIEFILSYHVDKIVVISKSEYKSALKYFIKKEKMVVINNSIDTKKYLIKSNEEILKLKTKYKIPKDKFIIGMCCRFVDQKDPIKFLEVAKEICRKRNDVFFVLVGEGELRDVIESYIMQNNLFDNIILTGWINDTEEIISIFDIGLLTSRWEGFGLVLLEYMILGKPIIAANIDAIPTIVKNGQCGYIVNQKDTNQYCECIKDIMENKEIYDKFKSNGIERVKIKFDVDRLIKEHMEII